MQYSKILRKRARIMNYSLVYDLGNPYFSAYTKVNKSIALLTIILTVIQL